MIISHIYGGLGNQMFQYAVGRALADKLGVALKLDVTDFACYPLRKYELDHLQINAEVAITEEITKLRGSSDVWHKVIGVLRRQSRFPESFIQEKAYTFDQSILMLGDQHYLKGYWQSEKYFPSITEQLRHEFQPITEPTEKNAEVIHNIDQQQAISVHVRRGDYVQNAQTNAYHGTTSLDYYKKAAEHIMASVRQPVFYVFSDDSEWVKANLTFNAQTEYMTHNGPEKSHEDMRLMSRCKHHIIANSTFSWWGAWLGTNPGKIIIAPKQWFNQAGLDDRDLVPASWYRI